MICDKCYEIVEFNSSSILNCDVCNREILSIFNPHPNLCIDCSNQLKVCEICGDKIK